MKCNIIVTKRDLSIFRFLHSYGLLKTSDIARRFFPGIAPTTMLRRLRKLEGEGLLARLHGLPGGELAWRLTQKAGTLVAHTPPRRYFPKQSLEHDLQLVDLRLALERVGIAQSWTAEHELRRQAAAEERRIESIFRNVPDGWMTTNFQNEKANVAIELELTWKNQDRYRRIFANYRYHRKLVAVWYFVSTKRQGEKLNELWRKTGGASVYFIWSLASEAIADPLNMVVRSLDRTYQIKNLFHPLKPVLAAPEPAQAGAQGVSSGENRAPCFESDPTAEDSSEKPAPGFC